MRGLKVIMSVLSVSILIMLVMSTAGCSGRPRMFHNGDRYPAYVQEIDFGSATLQWGNKVRLRNWEVAFGVKRPIAKREVTTATDYGVTKPWSILIKVSGLRCTNINPIINPDRSSEPCDLVIGYNLQESRPIECLLFREDRLLDLVDDCPVVDLRVSW